MQRTLKILTTAVLYLLIGTLKAQNTAYVDMKIGWRAMNTNLDAFNKSMPAGTPYLSGNMNAVELSFGVHKKHFMVHSDLSIGTRNRNFISNYEQIILTQTSWSLTAGPTYKVGKNKKLQFSTLAGVAYNSLDLKYVNDSINKSASIGWILNQAPNQLDEDPGHYTNPGFMLVVQQRATIILNKHFTLTAFVGYQQDMGKGRWHYEYGFIRRNSPETFGTGLSYGASLGLRFPIEPQPLTNFSQRLN